jgi:hypothetical protein
MQVKGLLSVLQDDRIEFIEAMTRLLEELRSSVSICEEIGQDLFAEINLMPAIGTCDGFPHQSSQKRCARLLRGHQESNGSWYHAPKCQEWAVQEQGTVYA